MAVGYSPTQCCNLKEIPLLRKKDIKIAIKALKRLDDYNFSQGAVIRNKKVLAVEGKSGTQKMLKKLSVFQETLVPHN